ncbi:Mu transposase domain-containing protein, partial [Bifidobacterium longum]|uniref:Mu transposase domain-containing protein n=1 Tax=Bifidobacterium longum TaxID=216816 RepID=UPI000A8A9EAB
GLWLGGAGSDEGTGSGPCAEGCSCRCPACGASTTSTCACPAAASSWGDKDHYRKGESQAGLFEDDRKALLPLPAKPFDVVTWTRMKADKCGNVTVQGRHRYAAGPEHAGHEMIVGLRALEVEILDAEGKRVITHPRSYGDKPTDSGDPSSQLGLLCDRPAAWRNSRVRDAMPDPLREWIDAQVFCFNVCSTGSAVFFRSVG